MGAVVCARVGECERVSVWVCAGWVLVLHLSEGMILVGVWYAVKYAVQCDWPLLLH